MLKQIALISLILSTNCFSYSWENCPRQYPTMVRMPVKDGWIVEIGNSPNIRNVYVPDKDHDWDCSR